MNNHGILDIYPIVDNNRQYLALLCGLIGANHRTRPDKNIFAYDDIPNHNSGLMDKCSTRNPGIIAARIFFDNHFTPSFRV